MLFNINTLEWDDDILAQLDIPKCMLPKPVPSSSIFGETSAEFFGCPIPIGGAAGDQQAALSDRPVLMQEKPRIHMEQAASFL